MNLNFLNTPAHQNKEIYTSVCIQTAFAESLFEFEMSILSYTFLLLIIISYWKC
jgi:hypothetical protein